MTDPDRAHDEPVVSDIGLGGNPSPMLVISATTRTAESSRPVDLASIVMVNTPATTMKAMLATSKVRSDGPRPSVSNRFPTAIPESRAGVSGPEGHREQHVGDDDDGDRGASRVAAIPTPTGPPLA